MASSREIRIVKSNTRMPAETVVAQIAKRLRLEALFVSSIGLLLLFGSIVGMAQEGLTSSGTDQAICGAVFACALRVLGAWARIGAVESRPPRGESAWGRSARV